MTASTTSSARPSWSYGSQPDRRQARMASQITANTSAPPTTNGSTLRSSSVTVVTSPEGVGDSVPAVEGGAALEGGAVLEGGATLEGAGVGLGRWRAASAGTVT